jgi:hypothetical protein
MKESDVRIIFQNLEEVSTFAEAFAGVLDGVKGTSEYDTSDDRDSLGLSNDRIGEAFLEMVTSMSVFMVSFH